MVRIGLLLIAGVAGTLAGLAACTGKSPVPAANIAATGFKPVAAQFRTVQVITTDGHRREQQTQWRFWRDGQRIVSESLDDRTGELWERDGATLFHRRLYHADKRSIESQLNDSQGAPLWTRQALIVEPPLLSKLTEKQSGWREGYPFRRYAGNVDGAHWDIVLRVDWMLPVSIERKQAHFSVRTETTAAYALPDAPWHPTNPADYEIIDAADLGDRELDPFVQKVHQEVGAIHRH